MVCIVGEGGSSQTGRLIRTVPFKKSSQLSNKHQIVDKLPVSSCCGL